MNAPWTLFAVCCLARLLRDRSHVLIGTNAAPHMSAALLANRLSNGSLRVTVIGSRKHSFLTDDLAEVFNCAAQGRFDCFIVGGGQIDGDANINLVGVGQHPRLKVRWPGSHGTPLLYLMIPNAIIFREEHSRRVMVQRVDFISAPGVSEATTFRPGGPGHLLTNLGLFRFNPAARRFSVLSVHPGSSVPEIVENTGFELDVPASIPSTPNPTSDEVAQIPAVCEEVAEIYPQFAARLKDQAMAYAAARARDAGLQQ